MHGEAPSEPKMRFLRGEWRPVRVFDDDDIDTSPAAARRRAAVAHGPPSSEWRWRGACEDAAHRGEAREVQELLTKEWIRTHVLASGAAPPEKGIAEPSSLYSSSGGLSPKRNLGRPQSAPGGGGRLRHHGGGSCRCSGQSFRGRQAPSKWSTLATDWVQQRLRESEPRAGGGSQHGCGGSGLSASRALRLSTKRLPSSPELDCSRLAGCTFCGTCGT